MHIPCLLSAFSRFAKIIGLLGLAASLVACSAIKLGYNTLDDVAYWWLDSYIDFSDDQAPRIREDLDRLHLWHRQAELPRFAAMLGDMEKLVPGDIAASQACAVVTQVRDRLDAAVQRAEPALVTLALAVSPEQLAHLERKFNENNAKFRKDWVRLKPEEQRDKRLKQYVERSEMIYGQLEEAQLALLRRQLEQSAFDPVRLLAERQRRQQDALQTLGKLTAQPVPLDETRRMVRAYVQRVKEPPDPAQRAYQQALIDENCRVFSAMHASTSAAQREAAVRRLRAYQRDVRELAAQQP